MTETFGMTQEQVSRSVGKSRPYITNSMRLLKLPEYIRESIADGRISAGHGRTLIAASDEDMRKSIWEKMIKEGLSVREAENLRPAVRGRRRGNPLPREKIRTWQEWRGRSERHLRN